MVDQSLLIEFLPQYNLKLDPSPPLPCKWNYKDVTWHARQKENKTICTKLQGKEFTAFCSFCFSSDRSIHFPTLAGKWPWDAEQFMPSVEKYISWSLEIKLLAYFVNIYFCLATSNSFLPCCF